MQEKFKNGHFCESGEAWIRLTALFEKTILQIQIFTDIILFKITYWMNEIGSPQYEICRISLIIGPKQFWSIFSERF